MLLDLVSLKADVGCEFQVHAMGDLAADMALSPDLLRSNEGLAAFGPLLSTAAQPSFENTSAQDENALLTKNRTRPDMELLLTLWNLITAHLLY